MSLKSIEPLSALSTYQQIGLSSTKRAGRGFNDNNTGRMLIPVKYIEEYNDDLVW